jgi:hypothetical protein
MPLVVTESTMAATENFMLNLSQSRDKGLLALKNKPSYIIIKRGHFIGH